MLRISFAIVFKKDGLDEKAIEKELNEIARVTETQDDKIRLSDGNWHDVKIYYFNGTLGQLTKMKLKYNCIDYDWILFPIESQW